MMKAFPLTVKEFFSKAFNVSILQKSRLGWVDYLRGIAILLIVYRHVLIGIQRGNIAVPESFVTANMIFYSFRMPLFFILSGLFISSSLAKKTPGQLIWVKFENLFYPYLIWTFIQITLQIFISHVTNSDRSLADYTYIFYQPRRLDQFWYLPALFNTTCIYILVKTRLKANIWAQLSLGLVLYFCSPYFQNISMISDWMEFYLFFAIGDGISRLFFKEGSQRLFKSFWTFLLIIPIFVAAQFYYIDHLSDQIVTSANSHLSKPGFLRHINDQIAFLFIAFIGCLTMFLLAFQLQRIRGIAFLKILGYHSLYIYVMHVIITAFTRLSLIILFDLRNPILLLLISIAVGVTIPVMVYNLLIKNNIGWFLFSFHKPRAKAATVKEMRPKVLTVEAKGL